VNFLFDDYSRAARKWNVIGLPGNTLS